MHLEIANGAILEGDSKGALEELFIAEQLNPNSPEIYHSEALAYFMKQDLTTAALKARRAVDLKPSYSEANNTLGKILLDLGRTAEAIEPLTRAANDPVYREAFKPMTNLGILHYRAGNYERADHYLTRAIADAPLAACVAFYYRGHIRLRNSRFSDAVDDYDKAVKKTCGASFADAHMALGIAYERSKQFVLARKKYLEIENRFPRTKVAEQAMNHLRSLP
jgi:Flp pilus assembly protein TadD